MKMYWNLLLYKEVPAASRILESEENYRNCFANPESGYFPAVPEDGGQEPTIFKVKGLRFSRYRKVGTESKMKQVVYRRQWRNFTVKRSITDEKVIKGRKYYAGKNMGSNQWQDVLRKKR